MSGTTPRMTPAGLQAKEQEETARYRESLHATWRDWRTWLQASLDITRLDASGGAVGGDFDAEHAQAEVRRQAEANLDTISADWQAVFQETFQQERARQHAQGNGTWSNRSPYDQDMAILHTLLEQAEGRQPAAGIPPGFGTVPIGKGKLVAVQADVLLASPDETSWSTSHGEKKDWTKYLIVGLILLLPLLVWLTWPRIMYGMNTTDRTWPRGSPPATDWSPCFHVWYAVLD